MDAIRPIRCDEDLRCTVRKIEALWDEATPGTHQADLLEVLSILVDVYEKKTSPMPQSDPIEAIKYRLENVEHNEKMLSELFGSTARAVKIMDGQKKLTLGDIRRVKELLGIPLEVLVQESKVQVPQKCAKPTVRSLVNTVRHPETSSLHQRRRAGSSAGHLCAARG